MKRRLKNIYYSFPVQLFLLHFKKYQVLLLIWYIFFTTINGTYLKSYGVNALFFAPEYNGHTNIWGIIIVGITWGMFIMSWNITTFILHSKRFQFLALTTHPFLKYCMNNFLLPLIFLIFYFTKFYQYESQEELKTTGKIIIDLAGILGGIILLFSISFIYFFTAGKTIEHSLTTHTNVQPVATAKGFPHEEDMIYGLKVRYYLSNWFRPHKTGNLSHIEQIYVDRVFKRHHLAAILVIVLGFVALATIGFYLDYPFFEFPAAACAILFFALLIAFVGALSYFLQSWSLPFAIVLVLFVNFLFEQNIIDPRNKAYGMDYINKENRPEYDPSSLAALCTPERIAADKANMVQVLNNWKAKQNLEKPLMIFINVSGGGLRSAAFTMHSLQQLDSLTNGKLMQHTLLISGASGGMLAATYYRELYRQLPRKQGNPAFYEQQYAEDISTDLLNPVFSSLVARDLLSTKQRFTVGKFTYAKDRGYAFEKKLGDNTHGLVNASLQDVSADEHAAKVPMIIFNAVINSDGRKLVIGSQPLSFMMKASENIYDSTVTADAVDFGALFTRQNAKDLRLVTALRLNASFPYILPNVWLPSTPVIDVMDAGLRDNYGQETTLRFIDQFKDWIKENTGGVLILQLSDSRIDNWENPVDSKTLGSMLVTPATMVQQNWHKLQRYFLEDEYSYFKASASFPLVKQDIFYSARIKEKTAAMNFHLTASEKKDVTSSFYSLANKPRIDSIVQWLRSNRLQ